MRRLISAAGTSWASKLASWPLRSAISSKAAMRSSICRRSALRTTDRSTPAISVASEPERTSGRQRARTQLRVGVAIQGALAAQHVEQGVEATGHVHPHHEAALYPDPMSQTVPITQHHQAVAAGRQGRPEQFLEGAFGEQARGRPRCQFRRPAPPLSKKATRRAFPESQHRSCPRVTSRILRKFAELGAAARVEGRTSPRLIARFAAPLRASRSGTLRVAMIIVTGTKRSGTSMWMQILKAAGYAIVGEPFRGTGPTRFARAIAGFLRITAAPRDLLRDQSRSAHGRVSVPAGDPERRRESVRARPAAHGSRFVHKVIATVRPWREYKNSVERLYRMEHQNREALRSGARAGSTQSGRASHDCARPRLVERKLRPACEMPLLRRYPLHLVSYAAGACRTPPSASTPRSRFLGAGECRAALSRRCCGDLQTQYDAGSESDRTARSRDRATGGPWSQTSIVTADLRTSSMRGFTGRCAWIKTFFSRLERTHARLDAGHSCEQARVQALWRAAAREPNADQAPSATRRKARANVDPRRVALRPRADRAYP